MQGDPVPSDPVPSDPVPSDTALARLRAICLSLPEAAERQSHGEPAWFAGTGRMFASVADHHHDDVLACWCAAPVGRQQELTGLEPSRYFVPPYVGGRGWVGVRLDVPVDWTELAEIVQDAYRQVASRRLLTLLNPSDVATRDAHPAAPGWQGVQGRRKSL